VYVFCSSETSCFPSLLLRHVPGLSADSRPRAPVLLKCFGCSASFEQLLAGLMNGTATGNANGNGEPKTRKPTARKPFGKCVANYEYRDAGGVLLFEKLRYERPDGKTFLIRRTAGLDPGEGVWNLGNVKPPLYRLPELLKSDRSLVLFTEGEKCADAARALGFVATTTCDGAAGKCRPEYRGQLQGVKVLAILPDADEPGEKYADMVARSAFGYAGAVKVIRLPGLGPGEDIVDFIAAGGTAEQIQGLIENTEPWSSPGKSEPLPEPEIRNRRQCGLGSNPAPPVSGPRSRGGAGLHSASGRLPEGSGMHSRG
jgi:hypothetical protein